MPDPDAYPPPARPEPHWPPLLVSAAAVALEVLLPRRLGIGPQWIVLVLGGLLFLRLLTSSPFQITGDNRTRRRVSIGLTGLVSIANGIALVLLVRLLLHRQVIHGVALIESGGLIWLINVLLFSLWYWELDRGGPGQRAAGEDGPPDFLYPQLTLASLTPGWRPVFFDYLYLSLTNATAFSPTDTLPLTVSAKMIMGLQAVISLVTVGLVIARAVNIL